MVYFDANHRNKVLYYSSYNNINPQSNAMPMVKGNKCFI